MVAGLDHLRLLPPITSSGRLYVWKLRARDLEDREIDPNHQLQNLSTEGPAMPLQPILKRALVPALVRWEEPGVFAIPLV